jgi:hypothetical protein
MVPLSKETFPLNPGAALCGSRKRGSYAGQDAPLQTPATHSLSSLQVVGEDVKRYKHFEHSRIFNGLIQIVLVIWQRKGFSPPVEIFQAHESGARFKVMRPDSAPDVPFLRTYDFMYVPGLKNI